MFYAYNVIELLSSVQNVGHGRSAHYTLSHTQIYSNNTKFQCQLHGQFLIYALHI